MVSPRVRRPRVASVPCGGAGPPQRGRGAGRGLGPGQHLGAVGVPAAQQPIQPERVELAAVGAPDLDRDVVPAARRRRLHDGRAHVAERRHRVVEVCAVAASARSWSSSPNAATRSPARPTRRVVQRHGRDAAVTAVGTRDHPERERDVGHTAREHADLRAGVAEGADRPFVVDHPGHRHAPRGRLDRGQPAEVRRQAHARARVGAEAERGAGRADDRRLAAARAARRARRVVGIARAPVDGVVGLVPPPYGGQLVLPSRIAPASRIRRTTVASEPGTTPARSGSPIAITRPVASRLSLTVNGTPRSGPSAAPPGVDLARGRERALGVDRDDRVVVPLTASIRRRCASTISVADSAPSRTRPASSDAVVSIAGP